MPAAHLHRLDFGPEELPPTSPIDLRKAWQAAHVGAQVGLTMAPGDIDGVCFRNKRGEESKFMFADIDAACWAASIDRTYGLETTTGISVLFRLLALIEIMSQARWLQPFFSLSPKDGATLDQRLLAAAAQAPLSSTGSFDIQRFKQAMGLEASGPTAAIKKARAKKPRASA